MRVTVLQAIITWMETPSVATFERTVLWQRETSKFHTEDAKSFELIRILSYKQAEDSTLSRPPDDFWLFPSDTDLFFCLGNISK